MVQLKTVLADTKKPVVSLADPAFRSARKAAIIGNYNNELQRQIKDHLFEEYNVLLPPTEKAYKEETAIIFDYQAYGEGLFEHLNELSRFYYALGKNRLFVASFKDVNLMDHQLVPLGQYYSKHRLDPIWNSSKARKFRFIMREFLEREKWYELYQPAHLVLTVPHKGGIWKGKRIYIRELIKAFHTMRKERWWKTVIAGGLYNLEVKKNKQNGYHIHLHVLCFQHKDLHYPESSRWSGLKIASPVNHVRDMIKASWKTIVGNDSGYDGIHYSSLYYNETDENGNRIREDNCYWMASDQDPETLQDPHTGEFADPMEIDMRTWKKHYVKPGDDVDSWCKGVMECLKYHFKPGCLEKGPRAADGSKALYDIELIREILEHTKGDRFMSKFGNLHNHPGLSLNRKLDQEGEPTEIDDDVLGSAAAAGTKLKNPFTGETALPEEYLIYVTRPEFALVNHDARGRPQVRLRSRSPVLIFQPGTSVLQAFTQFASRKFTSDTLNATTDEFDQISSWLKRFMLAPLPRPPAPQEYSQLPAWPTDAPNYCPF
jgi:hypothetical protein